MADKQLEVPQAMRELAEQNVKQAQAAYEQFTDFMSKAMGAWMGSMPANPMAIGFRNIQDQALEFVMLQSQLAQDRMQSFFTQMQQFHNLFQQTPEKSEKSAMEAKLGAMPSTSLVSAFKDVQGRVVAMAKTNAEAASALAEKITKAQNTNEILTLQTKFVQEQMQTFVSQTQELYTLIGETLKRPARP